MSDVCVSLQPDLAATEFIDLLVRSTLHERRPVHDLPRIEKMLRQADIIATARDSHGRLVGVARAITDFSYCVYLSDLAVDQSVQRQGIGRNLIELVRQTAGPQAALIVLAAPAAAGYYPKLGMRQHMSCWTLPSPEAEQAERSS